MHFKVHGYRGTGNLGDAVQTIALQRLLPSVSYAWRDAGHPDDGVPFVVNGWLGDNAPCVENRNCLFAGVFVDHNEDNYRWIANTRFREIGARDPATVMWCADRKIRAMLIGCATLTFDRYDGARSGTYAVDETMPGAESITHEIPSLDWEEQVSLAGSLLEKYRRAELVVTSRMHVALPCIAFGTPVLVTDPMRINEPKAIRRMSLMDVLGVGYGKPFTMDATPWRQKYIGFLERNLGIQIHPRPFQAQAPNTEH
jgi:hypothetical protein